MPTSTSSIQGTTVATTKRRLNPQRQQRFRVAVATALVVALCVTIEGCGLGADRPDWLVGTWECHHDGFSRAATELRLASDGAVVETSSAPTEPRQWSVADDVLVFTKANGEEAARYQIDEHPDATHFRWHRSTPSPDDFHLNYTCERISADPRAELPR